MANACADYVSSMQSQVSLSSFGPNGSIGVELLVLAMMN
jgi:hypothetical protein